MKIGKTIELQRNDLHNSHPSDGSIDDADVIEPPSRAPQASADGAPVAAEGASSVIDSDDAYDDERLRLFDRREVEDLLEFETEFKATIGVTWIDEEGRRPVEDAFKLALELHEDGNVTALGMVAMAIKTLLKGHLRGFGRYYTGGPDPWPRPSALVKEELDAEMPFALEWLRTELQESLEKEGCLADRGVDAADTKPK